MQYNTATLNNGLRIIHLPNNSKIAYCGYQIKAGTRNEKPGDEGLAHFCEHVTFKGTQTHTSTAIINKLESVGGDLNAFTNKEDTVFYSAIPVEHFAKAVDVLSDIVFYSIFPQAEIDKEVEVICDEIESYNDSPSELIYDETENAVFDHCPLGHSILGEAQQLRTYTTSHAKAFTQRLYRPDNAVFFAYGDIAFSRLVAMLRRAHGIDAASKLMPCPAPSAVTERNRRPSALAPYTPSSNVKEMSTHQTHVMLANRAYPMGDKRRIALYLMNNILGGPGMNARLNLSLRERHALVYTVESFITSYGDTGLWGLYFGCDPHDTSRCMRLVRKELDRFMKQPLTDTQLKAAKRQIKGQIGVACDSRESFALDFAKTFLHYGLEKDVTSLFSQLDDVTATDIQQVAQDIFKEECITRMIIK